MENNPNSFQIVQITFSLTGKDENMWLHVDAAYAGAGLLCPEMRYIADGIEVICF